MGGDHSPGEIVKGAVFAVRELQVPITLVGDEPRIKAELQKYEDAAKLPVRILPTDEVIGMDESPAVAIRKKKRSTISVGIQSIKEQPDAAFISAGNTGAVLMAATLYLRTIEGIDRPAIGAFLPTDTKKLLLVDAGANVEVHANQLFQFGIMGEVFSRYGMNKKEPTVGLLSNGEEETKGKETTKEAFQMMKQSNMNFIGNIEGKVVYQGDADVVVCDGYTGNIALKISESLAALMMKELRTIFGSDLRGKIAYLLVKPWLRLFKNRYDYNQYGGAPLLGVKGNVIISHGSSNHVSILNAIKLAKHLIENNVNQRIEEEMKKNKEVQLSKQRKSSSLWENIKETILPSD